MAASLNLALWILIVVVSSAMTSSESNEERGSELLSMQLRSTSRIIRLNDQSIARYITSIVTLRPYSILIFFNAAQLHDKAELRVTDLHNEFSIVASSFITDNANHSSFLSKLFFCDLEFKESQRSFSQFSVNALPHIRLVGPNMGLKDSEPMDQDDFSRLADSMAKFVRGQNQALSPFLSDVEA